MNPYGKKGGPKHQEKIQEIGKNIEKKGLIAFFEYVFKINGRKKKKRYADVVGLSTEMELIEIHQVGNKNKNGSPIKRERDAIKDIEEYSNNKNIKVQFHTYILLFLSVIVWNHMSKIIITFYDNNYF